MNLHALDIPEDVAQLPHWLEDHLLGLDLAELVAELSAIRNGTPATGRSLEDVLGRSLPRVLSDGLSVLPPPLLRELLSEPCLLLDLQERIFLEGGHYWETRAAHGNGMELMVARGRERLRKFIANGKTAPTTVSARVAPGTRWYRHPLSVCIGTAAAVLAAVVFWPPFPQANAPVAAGWGWEKPGALQQDVSAAEYLNGLAEAADDWFKKRPATPQALATRIAEFRQGCSTLILAEHRPLAPEDRQWLVEKCRAWAGKLDQHLAAVEAGRDVLEVRNEADETIRRLITALKTRATEVAA